MRAAAAVAVLCLAAASAAAGQPAAPPDQPLRLQALHRAYDLDFDGADATIQAALAQAPNDPASHLARASIIWIRLLFRRGALTVDEYLGPPSLTDVSRPAPPSSEAATLRAALATARALADERLRERADDAEALFAAGAAAAREAAYIATEEGRLLAAFRASRRAYDLHRRLIEGEPSRIGGEPSRIDAGLVVGTYRYLVATLSRVMRWLAYLAGFDGDKARAFDLLERCATSASESGIEARFGLVIVYSREGRHTDALRQLDRLRQQFPHNRLLRLETGATLLRAGRTEEGLRWIDEGIAALAGDRRPRSFGEDAWWHYQRGLALVRLGRSAEARVETEKADAARAYTWVKGRIRTVRGQSLDLEGRRTEALAAYAEAMAIGRRTRDDPGVQEARRWTDNPFRGTSPSYPRHNE